MAKLEDKRIRNNDFEQFEKCNSCNKGFWAKSKYELGNWESDCKKCSEKIEKNYRNEYSSEIKSTKEFYDFITPEISKLASTIDDVIREKKRELINNKLPLKIGWIKNKFMAIKFFIVNQGWPMPKGKKFQFMG